MSAHPITPDRAISPPLVAIACALLLLGQTLFALHQIEHISHPPHDDVCELCVIGTGLGSPLPALALHMLTVTASAPPPADWFDTLCRDWRGYYRYFPRAPPSA